jgi:tetratricopeptide (TPR) repeat protein
LGNALLSYGWYALSLLWPSHLAILYPWPTKLHFTQLALAAAFLCVISAMAWKQREHRPYLLVGWLWFTGSLLPVLGIVQVGSQARADRYAYVPMIGLLIAGVWTLAELVDRKPARIKWAQAGAVVVVGIFAMVSRQQIRYWSSDYDLWLHAFQVTTDNYLAANKVGVALQNEGRYDEALQYFERAWHINPSDPLANFNIGVHYHLNRDFETAIRYYEVTANQKTTPILRAEAFENMGTAYRQLGDHSRARDSYLNALQFDPTRNRIYAALREIDGNAQR